MSQCLLSCHQSHSICPCVLENSSQTSSSWIHVCHADASSAHTLEMPFCQANEWVGYNGPLRLWKRKRGEQIEIEKSWKLKSARSSSSPSSSTVTALFPWNASNFASLQFFFIKQASKQSHVHVGVRKKDGDKLAELIGIGERVQESFNSSSNSRNWPVMLVHIFLLEVGKCPRIFATLTHCRQTKSETVPPCFFSSPFSARTSTLSSSTLIFIFPVSFFCIPVPPLSLSIVYLSESAAGIKSQFAVNLGGRLARERARASARESVSRQSI